jgi:ribosomal protein L40E
MKCPKCQFDNREEAGFCRSCGNSLKDDIRCPNCKALNPSDSKYCEKCGKNLNSPKEIISVKYSEPQSYTPKHLADEIFKTRSSIQGERKHVTVAAVTLGRQIAHILIDLGVGADFIILPVGIFYGAKCLRINLGDNCLPNDETLKSTGG